MSTTPPQLQLIDVVKTYPGPTHALRGVSLEVAAGEIVCILGPSGCGKSTLLRVTAGLETPGRGRVFFAGRDLAGVPVHRRNFGLMFQEYALFPHLSVAENVAFGLRMAGWPRGEIAGRVAAMLDVVNLERYGDRSIFELSGGERQRVALARSLAPQPALLMLDEPLGSLDRALREELLEEIQRILTGMGVTALYVTHDQEEALALADRMVIMQAGCIEQVGTPEAVYTHPANEFVARFLGFANLLPAEVTAATPGMAQTPLGPFPLVEPAQPGAYTLLLRPEAARLGGPLAADGAAAWGFLPAPDEREAITLHARLAACTYRGREYRVQVETPGAAGLHTLIFDLPAFQRATPRAGLAANHLPPPGAPVELLIYPRLTALLARLDAHGQ
jgi:ABC-type Fe3+/spermidine/putrescine transport system ATPase subunit